MNSKSASQGESTDAINFVVFLLRWKTPLLVILLGSALISGIASGFIKPKFKSTVIFFPSTTNSISKALLSDNAGNNQDILEFGQEVEAEQMLQILHSDNIRDRIISKYDLMKHYEIEPDSKFPVTQLHKEYESNISFERTEFMSVKIIVYDTDAQMAADVANDIGNFLDSMKTQVQRQRALQGLKVVEAEYKLAGEQMKAIEDSLQMIRRHGIYDYTVQSRILNEEFTRVSSEYTSEKERLKVLEKYYSEKDTVRINTFSRVKGSEAAMKDIETRLQNLAKYGGANVALSDMLELRRKQISLMQDKYEKARVDAEQSLPHKFIVNNAEKAEKKTYPIRWLIVVLSTLASMILSILYFAVLEHYREYKSEKLSS